MSTNQRSHEIAQHFPTLLRRWCGAVAQLVDLSLSHPTLHILVRRYGEPGNLVIACIGPIRIHAPHQWEDCNIEVVVSNEGGFVVIDPKADVEIKENLKKYSLP